MKYLLSRSVYATTFAVLLASHAKDCVAQNSLTHLKKGINFIENSWPVALKKAQAENKYIFVDAYASWCGPCKQLKATTFKNNKVAEFFNKNFVNLTIDTEKGQGIELATKWGLESYPTLYIFDSKGKLIAASEGFVDATDFIKFGQQALKN